MRKRRSKKRLRKNMICVSIFHWISDGFWSHFWCFFDTFTIRTCNLLNDQKHLFFQWFSMVYYSEKHVFLWFSWSFTLQVLTFIFEWVLALNLAPFWDPFGINFHVFGWSFFWWFFESFLFFDRKGKFRCKKAKFPEARRNARGCRGGIKEGVQELGTRFW